jgi:hypothetical protein
MLATHLLEANDVGVQQGAVVDQLPLHIPAQPPRVRPIRSLLRLSQAVSVAFAGDCDVLLFQHFVEMHFHPVVTRISPLTWAPSHAASWLRTKDVKRGGCNMRRMVAGLTCQFCHRAQ